MNRLAFAVTAAAVASFGIAGAAHAQDPVKWTATAGSNAVAPGAKTKVKLSATIESGWHIYSITQPVGGPYPTKITVPAGQPFVFDSSAKITGTAPETKFDKNFGINVETLEGSAEYEVPVVVSKTAKNGKQEGEVAVKYQVCNASTCLPPKPLKLAVAVNVKGKGGK